MLMMLVKDNTQKSVQASYFLEREYTPLLFEAYRSKLSGPWSCSRFPFILIVIPVHRCVTLVAPWL